MAAVLGNVGYIYVAAATGASATSAIANIDSWNIDLAIEAIETTSFGTGTTVTARTYEPGIKGATGSMSGNYDAASGHQDWLLEVASDTTVENVEMELYINASHYFSLTATVTGVSIGDTVDGKATFTANFNADGAVTLN